MCWAQMFWDIPVSMWLWSQGRAEEGVCLRLTAVSHGSSFSPSLASIAPLSSRLRLPLCSSQSPWLPIFYTCLKELLFLSRWTLTHFFKIKGSTYYCLQSLLLQFHQFLFDTISENVVHEVAVHSHTLRPCKAENQGVIKSNTKIQYNVISSVNWTPNPI